MTNAFLIYFSTFRIITLCILFSIGGLLSLPLLKFQFQPSVSFQNIDVSYYWPNMTSKAINIGVTNKLEALCNRIEGVEMISSISENGYGSISISFHKQIDLEAARFAVASAIRQSWDELPEGVSYPRIRLRDSKYESQKYLLSYSLNSTDSLSQIKKNAERVLSSRLQLLDGIDRFNFTGGASYEWKLAYDLNKLRSLNIDPKNLLLNLRSLFKNHPVGFGTFSNTDKEKIVLPIIMHSRYFDGAEELLNIPIAKKESRIIYLKDIASLSRSKQKAKEYFRLNGRNSINLIIYGKSDINELVVNEKIREVISQSSKEFPLGYFLELQYDSSLYLKKELSQIAERLFYSLGILLSFIFFVSKNFRLNIVILGSLLTSLSISLLIFYLLRLEINVYSLAAITLSIGLILDNFLVMAEHLRHKRDHKVSLSLLAATLTTICPLGFVFLLEDELKSKLVDFAWILIVCLSVSFFISLFFIPALMKYLDFKKSSKKPNKKIRLSFYRNYLHKYSQSKRLLIPIIILAFGCPIFMLPTQWEGKGWIHNSYNKSLGNPWFVEHVKPSLDKIFGGSLRLFVEKVYSQSRFSSFEETSIRLTIERLPGNTIEQMNELVQEVESYLSQFEEVNRYMVHVQSGELARIDIYFDKNHEQSSFPYYLRSLLLGKGRNYGELGWYVVGLGDGFGNPVGERTGTSTLVFQGYNYEILRQLGLQLKERMLTHFRILEVDIVSDENSRKPNLEELVFDFDLEKLNTQNLESSYLFDQLSSTAQSGTRLGSLNYLDQQEDIKWVSSIGEGLDSWLLMNLPLNKDSLESKLKILGELRSETIHPKIHRINQEYRIFLKFEFSGPKNRRDAYINKTIKDFKTRLPLGFKLTYKSPELSWQKEGEQQYTYLILIILVIFIICSILFESIVQPLAIIYLVPVSYIGIFLSFYLFQINFDQGGFASFILVTGITVNSGIYIINEFNRYQKDIRGNWSFIDLYFQAFSSKIFPIFLTIISTILGFLPFLFGDSSSPFWYPLSVGVISGLCFSILGIFLYLPLFLRLGRNQS